MKRLMIFGKLPLLVLGLGFWSSAAVAQTFITLDYPGGTDTHVTGIDGNNVVGQYNDSSYNTHGFVYNLSTSSYTAILNYPGATNGTYPGGISGNNIVGWYQLSDNYFHGFLYNESAYTPLNDPLAGNDSTLDGTIATGISGNNIIGYYRDSAGETHGFLYNGSVYTPLDDPLAGNNHSYLFQGTYALGISGNNIVGEYVDSSDLYHGFLYNKSTGSFTTLDDPLAIGSWGTGAFGMSGNIIAGTYYVSLGGDESVVHGFLYDGSTYTTIDDPNALYGTYIQGISGNTVVGWYVDGSGDHGFVATMPEPSTLTLLGTALLGLGVVYLRRRRERNSLSVIEDSTLSSDDETGPAILSLPSRWTETMRRAA